MALIGIIIILLLLLCKLTTSSILHSLNIGEEFTGKLNINNNNNKEIIGVNKLKILSFSFDIASTDRIIHLDLLLHFEKLYAKQIIINKKYIENVNIQLKCNNNKQQVETTNNNNNNIRLTMDVKYNKETSSFIPIINTIKYFCGSDKSLVFHQVYSPFSYEIIKSKELTTTNYQEEEDLQLLRDNNNNNNKNNEKKLRRHNNYLINFKQLENIILFKFLIPQLNQIAVNPWENETIQTLQLKCKHDKNKCIAGENFFTFIIWQFISFKTKLHIINEHSILNKDMMVMKDNNNKKSDTTASTTSSSITNDCFFKPIATIENLHFQSFQLKFSTVYNNENKMHKGSHVAIFNFNNFKGKITFLKMPSFLLGMLANSILNQLDLNGKGIATRSSAMDPSWQIAGDISNGIRGFINVFAMKKLLLKLFPSSTLL